jgi:magnesium-transporting ATPase (P-type)
VLSQVLKQLDVSEEGLSSDEAERRLDRYGFNEPTPRPRTGAIVQPADALLLQARDLHVQQAALTGESLPAEKEAVEEASSSPPSPHARNRIFLGTSVVSGTATAVVVATGRVTTFGDIAVHLTARPPESEFERGTRRSAT